MTRWRGIRTPRKKKKKQTRIDDSSSDESMRDFDPSANEINLPPHVTVYSTGENHGLPMPPGESEGQFEPGGQVEQYPGAQGSEGQPAPNVEVEQDEGQYGEDDPPSDPEASPEEELPVSFIIKNWLVLWSVYLSTGTDAVTERQFIIIRNIITLAFHSPAIHWRSPENVFLEMETPLMNPHRASLPSYSTIHRAVRKDVLEFLTVPLFDSDLPTTPAAGSSFATFYATDRDAERRVNLVLPSAYAAHDIATPEIWDIFQASDTSTEAPIIHNRNYSLDLRSGFIVDEGPAGTPRPIYARRNDVVEIHLTDSLLPSSDIALRHEYCQSRGHRVIRARVLSIFGVRHYSHFRNDVGNDDISSAHVPAFLQFVDYTYIDDDDEKLLLKPGDIVVALRFRVAHADDVTPISSTIYVVHRFWTNGSERPRHLLHLRQNMDAPPDGRLTAENMNAFFLPLSPGIDPEWLSVENIVLLENEASMNRMESIQRVPSAGVLQNGEPYFIYRILLFTDGFTYSTLRSTSSIGIYMSVLNFGRRTRYALDTTRILALSPPNVSPYSFFPDIMADIVQGTTTGYLKTDAEGVVRRVFIDLVGIVGDTPAINYTIDVAGAGATAYCHLCTTSRRSRDGNTGGAGTDEDDESPGPGIVAVDNVLDDEAAPDENEDDANASYNPAFSRLDDLGTYTCRARHTFRHQSLADCAASDAVRRRLGVKKDVPTGAYPAHQIQQALLDARPDVPLDEHGAPLLPSRLHPYISSFISPDHLILNLAKDAMSFIFTIIHAKESRHRFATNIENYDRSNICQKLTERSF